MILPTAPDTYDRTDQDQLRGALEGADKQNVKSGSVFNKILMRDTSTGVVKTIVITAGAIVIS